MKRLFILSLLFLMAFTGYSQNLVKMRECIIEKGVLKELEIDYNPATGDRTVVINGVRKDFYTVYPKEGKDYAASQAWYKNSDPVTFNGKPYVKYGLPRILGVNEIAKTGAYKEVGVYTEAGITGIPEVIYIPVRQGCEFQPYQINCGHADVQQVSSTASEIQFKVTVTGLTGKISLNWKAGTVPIIKGQGTSSVTLNIKDLKGGDQFELSVAATDAKQCPVTGYKWVTVDKPAAANTKPGKTSKWDAATRKEFIDACIPNTKLSAEKGRAYCTCMLDKIVVVHPDPATIDKDLKKEEIEAWAKDCLPKQ